MNKNKMYNRLLDMVINHDKYLPEECRNAFILIKFYNDPKSVLGDGDSPTPEEYAKIINFDELFLNNDFVSLLIDGIDDEAFINRLSLQLLQKICFILKGSIVCQKEYIPDILIKIKKVEEKIAVLSMEHPRSQEYVRTIYRLEELQRHMKYSKYSEQQVRSFKTDLANCVCDKLVDKVEYFKLATEDMMEQKEQMLSKIANEHYNAETNDNNRLERYVINFGVSFDADLVIATVLDNRFTDIIAKFIQDNNLNDRMINNSIKFLEMGIKIKKQQLSESESYLIRYFDPDLIKQFDVNKAEQVMNQLLLAQSKREASRLHLTKKN